MEAHLVKFYYLISYLGRGRVSNITRLQTTAPAWAWALALYLGISYKCWCDSCRQLDRKLTTASNCCKSSSCLSSPRPEAAVSNTTIADNCIKIFKKWVLGMSIFTQNLTWPPLRRKKIFSNIGFIVFKRTGFATPFQRNNRFWPHFWVLYI